MQSFVSILLAFCAGSVLCLIAQLLQDLTALTPAKILVGAVTCGILLGALGLFSPLRELFGCGVTLPLVGFGANVAEGVRDAVKERGLLGAFGGAFSAAATGLSSALFFAMVFSLFLRSRPRIP